MFHLLWNGYKDQTQHEQSHHQPSQHQLEQVYPTALGPTGDWFCCFFVLTVSTVSNTASIWVKPRRVLRHCVQDKTFLLHFKNWQVPFISYKFHSILSHAVMPSQSISPGSWINLSACIFDCSGIKVLVFREPLFCLTMTPQYKSSETGIQVGQHFHFGEEV